MKKHVCEGCKHYLVWTVDDFTDGMDRYSGYTRRVCQQNPRQPYLFDENEWITMCNQRKRGWFWE